ncbi:putative transposase [Pseudooceanicola antarcticus]|uniref:Transposase n=1 Tax=Pseudooceanicola antarcticus TaxID=1247613 RepID=A0A285IKS7_9RHOB|nr:transposase [Pseudooceanicola antarcticus]PJE28917.1 transposase [Pseudooceanicola antarcticus]SNY47706.1 putative transposase [Pseudooceanicola antarcticus]
MDRYTRPRQTGASIFFTVCLRDRSSDLLVREVTALREAVMVERARRPFCIDAWVVLPDHMHCIWTLPPGDADYPVRWQAIKAEFSKRVKDRVAISDGKRRRGEVGIWKRRYWEHHIRDDRDMELHLRYCWGNPVRHGLVARAADWQFSSFHREVRAGLVAPGWDGEVPEGYFGERDAEQERQPGLLA